MAWDWPRVDGRGLARYVNPDATRWLRLDGRVEPLQARQSADGRRALVAAVYRALARQGIRYAYEQYHPSDAIQLVRGPAEVLDRPGEGTCLDLALLFCGLCQGFGLLPLLVVLDGHALAAVSLTHELDGWDALDRRERDRFAAGPMTDPAALRDLVASGTYVAVECTGFARSRALPTDVPEGAGRGGDGLLDFDRAVAAGAEQLRRPDRPLRAVIDVATAHYRWRIDPHPIDQTVSGERYTDSHRVVVGGREGVIVIPEPTDPLVRPRRPLSPPRPRWWVGRRDELAAVTAVADDEPVEVCGEAGVGKTALLQTLCHHLADTAPDGVVYVGSHVQDDSELLQTVFEQLYDSDVGFQVTGTRLAKLLADRHPIVAVDTQTLERRHIEELRGVAPHGGIVWTTPVPTHADLGRLVALQGLDEPDAITLIEQRLGRTLTASEHAAAVRLVAAVDGNPRELLHAAATAEAGIATLQEQADRRDDGDRRAVAVGLAGHHQQLLNVVAAVSPASLGTDRLAAITDLSHDEADHVLDDLRRLHLADTDAGRSTTPPALAARLETRRPLDDLREQILEHLERWMQAHAGDADVLAADADACLTLVRWNVRRNPDDPGRAIRLARRIEPALALRGRWGAWEGLLRTVNETARRTGDQATEAWTLHQLGSRSLCLQRPLQARDYLEAALQLRRDLDDVAGMRVTSHNLDALPPLTPPADSSSDSSRGDGPDKPGPVPKPWLRRLLTVLGAVAGGAVIYLLAGPVASRTAPLAATPEGIDFGPVTVAQQASESVVLHNTSDASLRIDSARVSGDLFAVEGDGCAGHGLAADAICSIDLRYRPATPGHHQGTLTITHQGGRIVVALEGRGVAEAVAVATAQPSTVDFGAVPVGTRNNEPVTVRNDGNAPLLISHLAVPLPFAVAEHTCQAAVPAGGSCTVILAFRPTRPGTVAETLTITHDTATARITLTGRGVIGTATLQPQPVDFGTVAVGQEAARPVAVSNTGDGPLTIDGIALTDPAFAMADDGCSGRTLTAGQDCRVDVVFQPSARGDHTATLTVLHDGEGADQTTLSGTGTAAPVGVADIEPDPVDFGAVAVGEAAERVVEVWNVGEAELTVDDVAVTDPADGRPAFVVGHDGCSGSTLAPGEMCALETFFRPVVTGEQAATLSVVHEADGPESVELTGNGIDEQPPTAPQNVAVEPVEFEGGGYGLKVTWASSQDNTGVVAYLIRRDGARIGTVEAPGTEYVDTAPPEPACEVDYEVVAVDASGNESQPGTGQLACAASVGDA